MARTDPQVNFRIPASLKEKLEAAAFENKRTLTAELISRVEASFEPTAPNVNVVKQSQEPIPLPDYMEQQMQKIIQQHLANAEQYFQKIIAEKIKILEGLTQSDIQQILEAKLK